MLGLNCLIKDTRAVSDIKNAISVLVGERIANKEVANFPVIYKELRNAGLEIDAESAGSLYNELFSKYDDKVVSSEEQVGEYVGKEVQDHMKSVVDSITGAEPSVKEKQIGKLSPEKQVASMIAKMFDKHEFGSSTKNVNSVMKQMGELVSKAARSVLPAIKQQGSKRVHDSLKEFFDTEKNQFTTLSGGVNTLGTLHNAVKTEVDNYVAGISDKLSDEDAEILKHKWDKYVDSFMKSAYDIMLGKSDQNKLLNEALKQVKVDGVQITDVNGNIKWNALMEHDNPETIAQNVKKLFTDGIKDEQGNVQKYSREEAGRIGDYFQGLYSDKLSAVKQAKLGNERSKNISAKNIISDFIKDQGFINLVKDKDGKLLLTQANWEKVLNEVRKTVGADTGIDSVVDKLDKYLSGLKNESGERKLTPEQVDIIKQEFRQTVAAKLVPGTAIPHAMDRLIALKNLNGGKSFQQKYQSALNNVVGVSGLDESTINQIKDLTQAAEQIMKGNNVSSSTSSNPANNPGTYAYQALSQIERRIKEIIREHKIGKSNMQGVIKYLGDNMGAASVSLLLNPGNFTENILTGLASNIAESINLAVTNPKLFSQLGSSQKDFWTAFASHVSGGVSNEIINDTDLTNEVQAGERLRFRAWLQDFSKRPISAILKSPAYAIGVVNRTLMNSFDAGFNSALLRKKAIGSIYNALKEQGLTGSEAIKLMDESLNITKDVNDELEKTNEQIRGILNKAGLHPTDSDMAQNKRDMKLSLYENALIKGAQLKKINVTPKQILESTKALVESSALQAKVLGGKKQLPINSLDFVNKVIYGASTALLFVQREAFKGQQKREQQGRLVAAAWNQGGAELWKNTIGRFAGGIANFMALATTATPYGFVTAASINNQKKSLLRDNPDAANIYKAEPGDIRKYAELHNLVRSVTIRAALGTLAITGFILNKLSKDDDDDDDSFVNNLMQTKSGRRMINKFFPLGLNIAANVLYDVDDKKLDTKMERLFEVLSSVTNKQYDTWGSLKSDLQRAKDEEGVQMALAKFFGGGTPTVNLNQGEQITRFMTTVESAFNPDQISEVKSQEEKAKAIYKEIDAAVDAFFINGSVNTLQRTFNSDEPYNRFKNE